jgi:IPT/TIG domain
MKKSINNKNVRIACIMLFAIMVNNACVKDKSGIPDGSASSSPVITSFAVDSAANGKVVIAKGSGLFDIRTIVFDKNGAPASFNPNLNTDNAIVFRVPDTAAGGPQKIVLTNSLGKTASLDFKVIALASVAGSNKYSFTANEEITLNGRFLDDVSKVVFDGTSTNVPIVSKTKTTLTIKVPATTASTVKFSITNASGTVSDTHEFVNADQAYIFFRDAYAPGVVNDSWGPSATSSTVFWSGSVSVGKTYPKGNWWVGGFKVDAGLADNGFKYLSFWVKGGLIDHTLYLTSDGRTTGGYGNSDQTTPLLFPANVWTYFKIPLNTLGLWGKGPTFKSFGFWIKGPDNADETFYFDDVMFIK